MCVKQSYCPHCFCHVWLHRWVIDTLFHCRPYAVAYLGEGVHGAMPPFGPTMKIFYRRLYMKKCVFCRFPARIAKFNNVWWFFSYRYNMRLKSPCEIASDMTLWFAAFPNFRKKWRMCGFHWTFKSKKCFSFTTRRVRGPTRLCPWTPLGAPPPGPRYRLALCALAMPPFAKS